MFCSACGQRNEPAGPACTRCGAALPVPSAVQPPPPPPPYGQYPYAAPGYPPPGYPPPGYPPPAQDLGDSASARMLLPVGRSGWAIAAGYLALFSLLLVPGPLALGCGLMAIRNIRHDPKLHGLGRAWFGVIAGGLATLVLLALLLGAFKR